jgi:hypothetical protein
MPGKQPHGHGHDSAAAMVKPHTAAVHVKGAPHAGGFTRSADNVQQNVQ